MALAALKRLFGKEQQTPITYEEAKRLVRDEDVNVRRELAERTDVKPEILYYLAEDEAPEVRRATAANEATPQQADLVLAKDQDEDVRSGLAERVTRSNLSPDQQDILHRMTVEVLEVLAIDQVTRVRRILTDALKDVPDAPHGVIRKLAGDVELAVCGPVLENSPVLTDDDLVRIIHGTPADGALAAITRRQTLGEPVCDAIVEVGDVNDITGLLNNASAQIREETLDRLVDRSPDVDEWHGPLVRRPRLSSKAAERLARFVAHSLFDVLQSREDLDQKTVRSIAATVERRIAREAGAAGAAGKAAGEASYDAAMKLARELQAKRALGQAEVLTALGNGDRQFVIAAVAVLADMPPQTVEQVVSMQSTKGLVSLAWRAELGMRIAVQLQTRLAGIVPKEALKARNGDRYPLTKQDMEWQLAFFDGMQPGKAQ